MSARKRDAAVEADDLADAPFLDDAERAESRWLLARESDPGAPAPSAELAADYAEIEDLLGSLPSDGSDEGWQEDVWRAVAAAALPSRPGWRATMFRWALRGAMAVPAAIVVWWLIPRPTPLPPVPELEVVFYHPGTTRSAPDEHVVGDRLVVTARPRKAGDLRIYRADGILVARCPRGPGCKGESPGALTIDVTLDAPVQYQVILADGLTDAPLEAVMDVYLAAARAANAHIIFHPSIDVH